MNKDSDSSVDRATHDSAKEACKEKETLLLNPEKK